jgi:phosphatidylglycerophosphate synthase
MQMHRTGSHPDWEGTLPHQQNRWQRAAAKSHGVITPGNAITLLGLALVGWGLAEISWHRYWLGGVLFLVGRLCDLLDGATAQRTGTKGPFGELLDATADKLTVGATFIIFFAAHIAPGGILLTMLLPHAIISTIAIHAFLRARPLHPSRVGKLSMAGLWLALVGFLLAKALGSGATIVSVVAVAIALLATLGSFAAIPGYIRTDTK